MRIESLASTTAARLVVVRPDATVRIAAAALSRPGIGLVVICDEAGTAQGVVSKSDLVRHVADVGVADAPVVNCMSRPIAACAPGDDLYATWQWMQMRGRQNIPVLGADSVPLGILDIRDALRTLFQQEEYEEQLLSNYIAGVGYQ